MVSQVLRIENDNRVSLSLKRLSVSVRSSKKDLEAGVNDSATILNDITFDLNSGSMLAIMGGSGSGKTTLLNTLSQRMNIRKKSLVFSGSIEYKKENDKNISNSYMMQSDIFDAGLTVFETLKIQADLRMLPDVKKEEKLNLIDSLLSILELTHLRDSPILGFWNAPSTLSGGERRRVSLAISLLSKPAILFLDEPTTGLDASSSLKLILILKNLASKEVGITIVLSIHQPRPEISILFDKICFLTRGGKMLFYGSLPEACSYFNEFGLVEKTNENVNIVEYAMNLLVKDTSTKSTEEETSKKIQRLVETWKEYSHNEEIPKLNEKESKKMFEKNINLFSREPKEKISFFQEVKVLSKRSFLLSIRDKGTLFSFNGVSIILGAICGWLFYKPDPDLAGIRSITSSLYVLLELIGFFPLLIEIERLWQTEGVTFMREHQEGYVSIPGFVVSRRLGKLLTEDLPVPIFFSCIVYFMWGLRLENSEGNNDPSFFFIFLAIAILTNLISLSLAMVAFSVCKNFAISTFLLNIDYQLQNLACGYFVNASTMPVYVRWTKYISHFWYAFGALTANQYHNWQGDCPYDSNSGLCDEYSGNYQLDILGYPVDWITEPICILLAWFVGFNLMAILFLYFKSYDMEIAKTKKNRIGGEEEEEEEEDSDEAKAVISKKKAEFESSSFNHDNIGYEVNIVDLSLSVNQYNMFWKKTGSKTLLNEINANFDAGKLNIIMGPSGSGKTTTLNYLSNRLSGKRNFTSQGGIYLNRQRKIDPEMMGRISSYVAQHDSSLIGNLTVRENLFFQAKLRLPLEQHNNIPSMVQTILRKTGLIDCADTLIGSDLVKGISGGEKRRVSIAIQLLSNPKIIFLDEPTSGLDSKTSTAILSLLNDLCNENNTTIILTIHQPSAEMFNEFGSLLLLARGGKVVYNGSSSKVSDYLSGIGYPCLNSNICDYLLDLVTVGMTETKEESQKRIEQLVNIWTGRKQVININSNDTIDLSKLLKQRLPVTSTFVTLCRRQLLTTIRSTDVLIARGFQTVFVAIFVAIYFAPLKDTQDGISNRLGLIQETLNLYFVGFVNNMSLFPNEKQLFFQEYRDGTYGVFEFSTCYLLNELPMEILTCLIYAIFIVLACGLPRDAAMYFTMFAGSFVAVNCGESLGIMIVSLFDHLGVAMNILNFCLFLAIFMGGTMSINMPDFFKGVNYINPMKYVIATCAKLGFEDQEFSCYTSECTLDTGMKVLENYNLNNNLGLMFLGLIVSVVVYRLIATSLIWTRVRFFL